MRGGSKGSGTRLVNPCSVDCWAEARASKQKEQKEAPATSRDSLPEYSVQWFNPVTQGASHESGLAQNAGSPVQSCLLLLRSLRQQRQSLGAGHRCSAASLRLPTRDRSSGDLDARRSKRFREAGRSTI
jgi:hypothetical protein